MRRNGGSMQKGPQYFIPKYILKENGKVKIEIEYYCKLLQEYHNQAVWSMNVQLKIKRIQNLLRNLHKQIGIGQIVRNKIPSNQY